MEEYVITIRLKDFNVTKAMFDFQSEFHDAAHTKRVMFLSLILGVISNNPNNGKEAFCAAMIHDMARKNENYCSQHGKWATETKLPLFRNLFIDMCGSNAISSISDACYNHSESFDFPKDHPSWLTTALLKDADALDRIRFGPGNLDQSYIRLCDAKHLIDFSEFLFGTTYHLQQFDFVLLQAFSRLWKDQRFKKMLSSIHFI